jgi:hypothetical protein
MVFDDLSWTKMRTFLKENSTSFTSFATKLFSRVTHLQFIDCFGAVPVYTHDICMVQLLNSCPYLVSFMVFSVGNLDCGRIVSKTEPFVFKYLRNIVIDGVEQDSFMGAPHLIEVLSIRLCHHTLIDVTLNCCGCCSNSLNKLLLGNSKTLKKIDLESVSLTLINCRSLWGCKHLTNFKLNARIDDNLQECVKILTTSKAIIEFVVTSFTRQQQEFSLTCHSLLQSLDDPSSSRYWVMDFQYVPTDIVTGCLVCGGSQVKFLSLESIEINDMVYDAVVKYNVSLMLIRFKTCHSLTVGRLKALVSLARVRALTLDQVFLVPDMSIVDICLANLKLKQVSIFHYSNLTLEDVNRIFNLHKGVQEVRCGSCNLISADKIVSFKRVKDSNELSVKFITSIGQKLRSAWF